VSKESVIAIGQHLKLPPARCLASRPSTTSSAFIRWQVPRSGVPGTACHVKDLVFARYREERAEALAGTDQPGSHIQLGSRRLFGGCGLSPVMCVNGEFFARMTPTRARKLLDGCRKEAVQS